MTTNKCVPHTSANRHTWRARWNCNFLPLSFSCSRNKLKKRIHFLGSNCYGIRLHRIPTESYYACSGTRTLDKDSAAAKSACVALLLVQPTAGDAKLSTFNVCGLAGVGWLVGGVGNAVSDSLMKMSDESCNIEENTNTYLLMPPFVSLLLELWATLPLHSLLVMGLAGQGSGH